MEVGSYGGALTRRIRAHVEDPDVVSNLPGATVGYLAINGPCRPVDVQHLTGLSSGGVTKLLDSLEAKGVVTRTHGAVESDRRAILVTLTAFGQQTADRLADGVLAEAADARDAMRRLADLANALAASRRD